jgi:acetyl esterase/lipase
MGEGLSQGSRKPGYATSGVSKSCPVHRHFGGVPSFALENPYPAANDDAWTALTWVADHASEIGVDPQRLAVGGDSAGGLLAAWVTQKAAKTGPKLRLQVLLYPNLDATMSRPSWKELGTGAYLASHAQMIEWYDAYLPYGINREDPKVSPLFATDLNEVAPALIITADHDPLPHHQPRIRCDSYLAPGDHLRPSNYSGKLLQLAAHPKSRGD